MDELLASIKMVSLIQDKFIFKLLKNKQVTERKSSLINEILFTFKNTYEVK